MIAYPPCSYISVEDRLNGNRYETFKKSGMAVWTSSQRHLGDDVSQQWVKLKVQKCCKFLMLQLKLENNARYCSRLLCTFTPDTSEKIIVSMEELFLITKRITGTGFFFMQVLHMFHNIYFLFRSIVTERALELCRLSTLIATMPPQGAVSKVNFSTVVALEDSFLVCC
jgi:hypothetical protein